MRLARPRTDTIFKRADFCHSPKVPFFNLTNRILAISLALSTFGCPGEHITVHEEDTVTDTDDSAAEDRSTALDPNSGPKMPAVPAAGAAEGMANEPPDPALAADDVDDADEMSSGEPAMDSDDAPADTPTAGTDMQAMPSDQADASVDDPPETTGESEMVMEDPMLIDTDAGIPEDSEEEPIEEPQEEPVEEVADCGSIKCDCTLDGIQLWGRVQIVDFNADFQVREVTAFADLQVQQVDVFPDQCGKWQIVDFNADFTVQIVANFGDFDIQYVDAFPGIR